MVKLSVKKQKKAPEGFQKILPSLVEFDQQLKEVGGKKDSQLSVKSKENLWKIIQIHNDRTRFVYSLYYKRKTISRELYEWLLKEKYADKNLIAKWKKQGYEKLCCLQCIHTGETNHGNTCICRVPRLQLEEEAKKKGTTVTFKQCVNCGCTGCASTD